MAAVTVSKATEESQGSDHSGVTRLSHGPHAYTHMIFKEDMLYSTLFQKAHTIS